MHCLTEYQCGIYWGGIHLDRYHNDGNVFLQHIVTIDRTWTRAYDIEWMASPRFATSTDSLTGTQMGDGYADCSIRLWECHSYASYILKRHVKADSIADFYSNIFDRISGVNVNVYCEAISLSCCMATLSCRTQCNQYIATMGWKALEHLP